MVTSIYIARSSEKSKAIRHGSHSNVMKCNVNVHLYSTSSQK